MSPQEVELLKTVIPALAALVGAAIGAGGTIFVTLLSKRAENRRHLRETAVNAAVEGWKQQIEIYKGSERGVASLPEQVWYMSECLRVLGSPGLSKEQIKSALAGIAKRSEAFREFQHEQFGIGASSK